MFSKTQCRATVGDVAQGDAETFHVAVTLDSLQRIFRQSPSVCTSVHSRLPQSAEMQARGVYASVFPFSFCEYPFMSF